MNSSATSLTSLLADLRGQLANAELGYANCSYIDNHADMRRAQDDWKIEIDKVKAAIAEAEKP